MGNKRPRPRHLAKKLLQIRLGLGLSQKKLVKRLDLREPINYTTISKYELDKNEPPLEVLLAYSRAAGISVEEIIDDDVKVDDLALHVEITRCPKSA